MIHLRHPTFLGMTTGPAALKQLKKHGRSQPLTNRFIKIRAEDPATHHVDFNLTVAITLRF